MNGIQSPESGLARALVGANAAAQNPLVEVRVSAVANEALGIRSFEFRAPHSRELPHFEAGAHIDVHLPDGLIRSFSLTNPQHERDHYLIAVNLDDSSRGGSRFMHEHLRAGDLIRISPPRNNFALFERASHSVLIAGGIGITPLWCMIQRLEQVGRSWELHYCARTRERAAFLKHLSAYGAKVHYTFSREPGIARLDVASVVRDSPADAHLYCCGPSGMLRCFEEATAGRLPDTIHVEYFASVSPAVAESSFTVTLARKGQTFAVLPGRTILQTLLDAGIEVPHSCAEGVCGTCETRVLGGIPEHRDLVLSKAQKAAGDVIMVCCSRCKSGNLVLDL